MTFINLTNKTEFSFGYAFGQLDSVIEANKPATAAGMCDRVGTWGYIDWQAKCKKNNVKPIFGVELMVVKDIELNEVQRVSHIHVLAKNQAGLQEIHWLVEVATEKFYYIPRISWDMVHNLSDNVFVLHSKTSDLNNLKPMQPNTFIELSPASPKHFFKVACEKNIPIVATSDSYYPTALDRSAYEIIACRNAEQLTTPMHIIDEWEWRLIWQDPCYQSALDNQQYIVDNCNAELMVAELVKPEKPKTLLQMCQEGAVRRNIDLEDSVYKARLKRELDLIDEKNYEDYFFLVSDLCVYAKKHMFVGPARGSSCGSLVCYLIDITDIDPIVHNLLFERFIDVNREDLPDIDIDFQDDKREMVFEYLQEKYGKDCVAKLGTINKYKPKKAIQHVSKELAIAPWDVKNLKEAIVERSGGDARSAFCIADTFELDIGQMTLKKYPQLAIAAEIEGHASHTGQHAAGILVTEYPIRNYASVDKKAGAVQVDKYGAERINLLKIDVLGLRTLAVLKACCDMVGWDINNLINYPLDDQNVYQIFRDRKFAGIFQFEGFALKSVCSQVSIEHFEDIACITALARPGPLHSGGTTAFIHRRMGRDKVEYLHEMAKEITQVTYGVVVYQEQVMQIAREIGKLSWEDVSQLRKAMSRSLGVEFFNQYWVRFEKGAAENGIDSKIAKNIWDHINTMGSWAFNRSHAVAYGMISYWCAVLKVNFPLEFAVSTLQFAKDDKQTIKVLRELCLEGYEYVPVDKYQSRENWAVMNGRLVGGLTALKGIGKKKAQEILKRRDAELPLTPTMKKMLEGKTPWDDVFEGNTKWGHIMDNPSEYGIVSKIWPVEDITIDMEGIFTVIVKIVDLNLRDANEAGNLEKRKGVRIKGQSLFLNFTGEDDTGSIIFQIQRSKYLAMGKKLVEISAVGDWYIIQGWKPRDFVKINVNKIMRMTGNERFLTEEQKQWKHSIPQLTSQDK